MIKNSILGIFTCFLICLSITSISAQKFGYINSSLLLTDHPDIKSADTQLVTYQNQLIEQGQNMVKSLETKYNTYMEQANKGELSQVQMQQKEGELSVEQQEIQKFEQEVQMKIGQKREELYQPILDKVKGIIEDIGKEQGYTMIFDSSSGGLLSASEEDDLIIEVKKRLGI